MEHTFSEDVHRERVSMPDPISYVLGYSFTG